MLIWPRQSFHTVCCWIFPAPVVRSILAREIAVLRTCSTWAGAWLACMELHNFPPIQTWQTWMYSGSTACVRTQKTRQTPWQRGGPCCSGPARLGRAFQSIENRFYDDICQLVSRPGFFEILIASQAPPHKTPSKVRKLTFPQGISVCVGSLELRTGTFSCPSVPPKVNQGPAGIYRSGMTGIQSHWVVCRLLQLPWICLLLFLPGLCWHPTADPYGLCSRRSTLFHVLESLWVSHGSEVPGISFLLSVEYVPFMEQNSALDLFPLQRRLRSCTCPFYPLLSARQFCLYMALNRQFQQFPVGFGCFNFGSQIVKQIACSGQEQEQSVNTAHPLLPKLRLHKFSIRASSQQQSRDALQTSILWIFHDPPVNSLNQTGNEMMCYSGIPVERHLCRIIARRLDSKASSSGSLLSIMYAAFWISNSILNLWNVLTWQLYKHVHTTP